MSDLISRQAVINRINKLIEVEKKQGTDDWGYGRERVNAYEAMLHMIESEYLHPSVESEKCGDCISRESALEILDDYAEDIESGNWGTAYSKARTSMCNLSSVEPERKTGKWEWNQRTGEYVCSECGCNPIYERTTPDCSEIDKYKFCRWCGAKMMDEQTLKYADNDTASGGLQSAT